MSVIGSVKRALGGILHRMQPAVYGLFLKNEKYFYGVFKGSDQKLLLLFKNLRNPDRIKAKIKYGQVLPLPRSVLSSDPIPAGVHLSPEMSRVLREFRKNGAVTIPGNFADLADHCLKYFKQ